MTWLVENPIPIVLGGIAIEVILAVMLVQTRRGSALAAMVIVFLITAGLLVVEWLVVTPREQVERLLDDVASALETNDLSQVLRYVSPDATEMRDAAERTLPEIDMREARITDRPQITVNELTVPPSAKAKFTARFDARWQKDGMPVGKPLLRFQLTLVREDDRWLLSEYEVED